MTFTSPSGLVQPTEPASPQVDAIQKEVMTAISPDGRPPDIASTRTEWKLLALIGIPVGVVCVAIMLFKLGVGAGILAAILLALYIAATVPVWGAGLMRGKEERLARKVAQSEVVAIPNSNSSSSYEVVPAAGEVAGRGGTGHGV